MTKRQTTKAVCYYRVSTDRQGRSGLGLEAQQAAVAAYCAANSLEVVQEYTEIESGRKNDRPVLSLALAHAKKAHARLVIAKLDRLARNVAFIATLMESGVDFAACDMPEASRLVLHIMAAVAEAEALAISQRTKAALEAYKARGGKLGAAIPSAHRFSRSDTLLGSAKVASNARLAYGEVLELAKTLRSKGLSYVAIARELTASGYLTRTGKPFSARQAQRVLEYAA